MKKSFLTILLTLSCLALLLSGCKSAPVYNVHDAAFVRPPGSSLYDIEQAIVRGCRRVHWQPKVISPGKILAHYSTKKHRYAATVAIDFDHDSYDISYVNSQNLKYHRLSEQNGESDSFFSEHNPFADTQNQSDAGPQATIHKVYNQWVSNLEESINTELTTLAYAKPAARTKYPAPTANPAQATNASCSDQPASHVSGRATIDKSRVNLRKGASSRCPIVGSIIRGEVFTLQGKKNSWYYIVVNRGEHAWIYAPLVTRIAAAKSASSSVRTPIPAASPPAPAPPSKRISIAVIHFKTLNKEAQDIALGELISETFTSALVNSHSFKIIEREQLDKVVKEMEMSQTGFIDATDAVEIGKMLHADAIITGSVALLGGQIQLNARIIEIESAYVISADTKTTRYTLENINKIVNEIVDKLSRKLSK